jgi:pyridoxine/pyridoxamine 5'-phosphate oxidase
VVSRQGAKLDDYQALAARAAERTAAGAPVARPQGQAGIVLVPETAEFWHGQASLLHYRLHYARAGTGWASFLLQP